MQQFDVNKRFHLIARRRDNNQDEILFEFNEEFQFHYYMSEVDKEKYKDADIIEKLGNQYPISRMPCEFKDNTPYFEKYKKRELKKKWLIYWKKLKKY